MVFNYLFYGKFLFVFLRSNGFENGGSWTGNREGKEDRRQGGPEGPPEIPQEEGRGLGAPGTSARPHVDMRPVPLIKRD